jgi:hypothetical protein
MSEWGPMRFPRLVGAGLFVLAACRGGSGHIYDPKADAWEQLEAAGRHPAAGNRRVLAAVGGDW